MSPPDSSTATIQEHGDYGRVLQCLRRTARPRRFKTRRLQTQSPMFPPDASAYKHSPGVLPEIHHKRHRSGLAGAHKFLDAGHARAQQQWRQAATATNPAPPGSGRAESAFTQENRVMTNTSSKEPLVPTSTPINQPLQFLPKGSEIAIRVSMQSEPDSYVTSQSSM